LNTKGQEILNAARELQNKLDSHRQESDLAIATISQEEVQHKDYVDDKFNSVTGNIRKHITKITATLRELQNEVAVKGNNSVQQDLARNAIVRVPNCDQASTAGNSVTSNVNNVTGSNGSTDRVTVLSSDNQSLISISDQSGNGNYVNAIPDHQHKDVGINDITLLPFTDTVKEVPLHSLWELDIYFNLQQTPERLKLLLAFKSVVEPLNKQWFSE
jgi:hypothetical protein